MSAGVGRRRPRYSTWLRRHRLVFFFGSAPRSEMTASYHGRRAKPDESSTLNSCGVFASATSWSAQSCIDSRAWPYQVIDCRSTTRIFACSRSANMITTGPSGPIRTRPSIAVQPLSGNAHFERRRPRGETDRRQERLARDQLGDCELEDQRLVIRRIHDRELVRGRFAKRVDHDRLELAGDPFEIVLHLELAEIDFGPSAAGESVVGVHGCHGEPVIVADVKTVLDPQSVERGSLAVLRHALRRRQKARVGSRPRLEHRGRQGAAAGADDCEDECEQEPSSHGTISAGILRPTHLQLSRRGDGTGAIEVAPRPLIRASDARRAPTASMSRPRASPRFRPASCPSARGDRARRRRSASPPARRLRSRACPTARRDVTLRQTR